MNRPIAAFVSRYILSATRPTIEDHLMANNIQHLVVLMMENRSFDHMFGFLKSPSYPIDGLNGTETNPDSLGVPIRVSPDAHYAGDFTPDPGHDFISVNEQIFSNSQGTGNGPFMQGFIKAYQGKTGNVAKSHNIMRCFSPGRLPALTTLAQEYAICDRWFASVPGPTLPNRAFAFGATSLGRVDMTPLYISLRTIFQLLDEHGVSSKLYYTDWTLGLAIGFIMQHAKKFLFFFDDFLKDCKNNKLPSVSFVEPRFNDLSDRGQFFPAADQHPDHNVFQGEKVIKAVYDAITSNQKTWESTLLVITYDEHGGLYDHVTPPATVNPNPNVTGTPVFNFDRLGVRVPAVLVSPFIQRQTIIHNKVFDHTSIIATARKLFIKDWEKFPLTKRDAQANTFEDCLTLTTPRPKVKIPQPSDSLITAASIMSGAAGSASLPMATGVTAGFSMTSEAVDPSETSNNPLNDFQESMIHHAFAFEGSLPASEHTGTLVSSITTEQAAAEYLAAIRARIEKTRKRTGTKSSAAKTSKQKAGVKKASKKKKTVRKKAEKKAGKKS
jgi:phospholipase C